MKISTDQQNIDVHNSHNSSHSPSKGEPHHNSNSSHHALMPIINVADFDGNGTVNRQDIILLNQRIAQGANGYHPLYDLNTDGEISWLDRRIARADRGKSVPLIEQQVAQATQATMKYFGANGLQQALSDGYLPATEEAKGHGYHYYNFALAQQVANNKAININQPVGLNFNDKGELIAVFYIRVPKTLGLEVDPSDDMPPTSSFHNFSDDDWHTHQSSWVSGLGNVDPRLISFEEDVPKTLVLNRLSEKDFKLFPDSDSFYFPKFYMLHGWFHNVNPNGRFAITNPTVAPYAPEELGVHSDSGHHAGMTELITGSDDSDPSLFGTRGADQIHGFDGDDHIWARMGNDSVHGGQGNDTLRGGVGDDMLYGGRDNDLLLGHGGHDRLFGGTGDDVIRGGIGDDLIHGGLGQDILRGGAGSDWFVLAPGEGTDIIRDFSLEDRIVLAGGITFQDLTFNSQKILAGSEILATISGFDTTTLSADTFIVT